MENANSPEYLTPTETARLLRVHVKSVWRWILRGQLEHVKRRIGRPAPVFDSEKSGPETVGIARR